MNHFLLDGSHPVSDKGVKQGVSPSLMATALLEPHLLGGRWRSYPKPASSTMICRERQWSDQKETGGRTVSVRQCRQLETTAITLYHPLGLRKCHSSVAVSSSLTDPEASGSRETQDVLWGCTKIRQSPAAKCPEAGLRCTADVQQRGAVMAIWCVSTTHFPPCRCPGTGSREGIKGK